MKMRVLLLFLALRPCCGALAAPMLTHAWRVEATRPAETSVVVRQGETLRLECSLLERAQPIHPPEDASSRFFWRDAEAKGDWWSAPASRTDNTLAFDWTPAQDPGARRYDFVLSLESPSAGTLYRAAGILVMQPSPGFNPAELAPPDVRQELIDAITADLQAWAEGRFLSAERIDQTLDAPAADRVPSSALLDGQLAAKASKTHTHRISEVTLLQSALDKKADADDLDLKADKTHTHTQAQVSGLSAALAAKANATHTHTTSAITDLYATLNPIYAAKGHDHTLENVGVEIRQELLSKAEEGHTHEWIEIVGLMDTLGGYLTKTLAAATYQPKGDYLTAESDPTVPAWAKAPQKPTYTAAEVGAAQASHTHADLAPISAVSMVTNGFTYIWVWDPKAGCHALTKNGAEPIYAE